MDGDLVDQIAQRYSADAAAYRELWAPELLPLARMLLDRLDPRGAERFLDLGAGVGALYEDERAAMPDSRIVLADRAEGMIRLAPAEASRVLVDARFLPFRNASFDVAVMAFVLFHVPQPIRALKGLWRVLAPGGRLGLATWGENRARAAITAWVEVLDEHGAEEDVVLADHDLMDNETKVRGLLGSAGFAVESVETVRSEHPITLNQFIGLRTRIGPSSRRLRSLDAQAQASCVREGIERIKEMDPRELVDDVDAILTIARRDDRSRR